MSEAHGPNALWWRRGVIYQIYPRSFRDSNGDGVGDLPGITAQLDYLADVLKIDAIWLSPFYPSPMADFGYDVSNYVDVHPLFGTLADFDALLAAAHERDIAVIVDFVPNHTSDQHPWFLESRSSRQSPRRDWYIWRDARPDGSPPNNWQSMFGGGAWEWDNATQQYYLHLFLKEQPDLNWRNPAVKEAMFDVLRFWLRRGVDGFRIDVAHFIMKDPRLPDNPPNPDVKPEEAEKHGWAGLTHVYDLGHADVHGVFREVRRVLDEFESERPRVAIGEIHETHWPTWVSYYGAELDELHMPFNFALLTTPWSATAVRAIVEGIEDVVRHGAWPNYVLGNHDTHRLASRIGPEAARVGVMLLLTLRGTPTIYYGEELGMTDGLIPPERVQDPFELNVPGFGLGRDPERTPMQWDASDSAGFTAPGVTPWLPLAGNHANVNVAVELQAPDSPLTLTRRLLELRRATPALHSGAYRTIEVQDPDCYVYERAAGGARYVVALNFSADSKAISLPLTGRGKVKVGTHVDAPEWVELSSLAMRPSEGLVIELSEVPAPE